jgi:signal transduction histidine kinase
MNYVSNALKYADDGKEERWVRIMGHTTPSNGESRAAVVVEVRDNGRGVAPEQRGRLFERFYRAGGNVGPDVDGTGLGLSIVRETVESLGGRAWAEFNDDETIFAFSLPSRRESDQTPQAFEAIARESVV